MHARSRVLFSKSTSLFCVGSWIRVGAIVVELLIRPIFTIDKTVQVKLISLTHFLSKFEPFSYTWKHNLEWPTGSKAKIYMSLGYAKCKPIKAYLQTSVGYRYLWHTYFYEMKLENCGPTVECLNNNRLTSQKLHFSGFFYNYFLRYMWYKNGRYHE
jgi:hypothetical protein